MPVDIEITNPRSHFRPGMTVCATCAWQLDRRPKRLLALLIWTTSGRGTTDAVAAVTLDISPLAPPASEWDVELTIPLDAPPSYDGRLMSIQWSVRLDTGVAGEMASVEFVVSPTGKPLTPQRLLK